TEPKSARPDQMHQVVRQERVEAIVSAATAPRGTDLFVRLARFEQIRMGITARDATCTACSNFCQAEKQRTMERFDQVDINVFIPQPGAIPMPSFLFAYGTLMPADASAAEREGWQPDAVRGRLFDLGPYPALVDIDDPGAGWVEGFVRPVDLRELEE